MPHYIISARDPRGRSVTDRFEGPTPAETVRGLRAQGYQEVTLLTDDILPIYEALIRQWPKGSANFFFTPDGWISQNKYSFWPKLWRYVYNLNRKWWWMVLPPAALITVLKYKGHAWGLWDCLLVLIALVPSSLAMFIILLAYFRWDVKRRRFLYDLQWCRWDQALRQVGGLTDILLPFELAASEAQILVGMGRLPQAEKILQPFQSDPAIPRWLYLYRVANTYRFGEHQEQGLAFLQEAHTLAPDNAAVSLALATWLIRFQRDLPQTRAVLDTVDVDGCTECDLCLRQAILGIVDFEGGRSAAAIEKLATALEGITPYARASVVVESVAHFCLIYLALASAQGGDLSTARKYFRRVRARLQLPIYRDLLERCEEAGLHR